METKDGLKEHRDNLERELHVAEGHILIGLPWGEMRGSLRASAEDGNVSITMRNDDHAVEVEATQIEALDAARVLVGAAMDADGDNWDGLWHDFKMSIQERRERIPKKSAA